MKQSSDFILSQLQRDFVADAPEQREKFQQQTVKRFHQKTRQRFWVLLICSLLAITSLLMFFPVEPLMQVVSSDALMAEISQSTVLLAALPLLVVAYVMFLIENTR